MKAYYHLPGLFEFYEFYKLFLPLYFEHREYFYDWCEIASIYGAPADVIWGGGREGLGDVSAEKVLALTEKYGISARLTFSNSLLQKDHLHDPKCNRLCSLFEESKIRSGVIVHSDLLLEYLRKEYPNLYFISSTTKVITDLDEFQDELMRPEFSYVVPDFRMNKSLDRLSGLPAEFKDKVEFLCNECCYVGCPDRKECYEAVSRKNLGIEGPEHICNAPSAGKGYRFSLAMESPAFISVADIKDTYLPMGFSNFKLEGRTLGNAILLEFLLYYLIKPEYHILVREALYLDSMLDLF